MSNDHPSSRPNAQYNVAAADSLALRATAHMRRKTFAVEADGSAGCAQIRARRVARRAVFLTTSNRWFPIEVHTSVPLLHWVPAATYRALLASARLRFFADEANLSLLSAADLLRLRMEAGIRGGRVDSVRLLGWPSNLLLSFRKSVA